MKGIALAVIAALSAQSNALKLHDHTNTHYSSQEQCDELKTTPDFYFEFNQDACRCFFNFTDGFNPCNGAWKPRFNPLHVPHNYYDLCISEADYQALFTHDLDENCQAKSTEGSATETTTTTTTTTTTDTTND